MPWKRPKVFKVGVYDIEIDVFDSIERAQAYAKRYQHTFCTNSIDGAAGFAATVVKEPGRGETKGQNAIVIAIPPHRDRYTLLAHESAHACHMILDFCGVPMDMNNTEAMAYLQDHIFKECALLLGMDT